MCPLIRRQGIQLFGRHPQQLVQQLLLLYRQCCLGRCCWRWGNLHPCRPYSRGLGHRRRRPGVHHHRGGLGGRRDDDGLGHTTWSHDHHLRLLTRQQSWHSSSGSRGHHTGTKDSRGGRRILRRDHNRRLEVGSGSPWWPCGDDDCRLMGWECVWGHRPRLRWGSSWPTSNRCTSSWAGACRCWPWWLCCRLPGWWWLDHAQGDLHLEQRAS
mmetsp:Transcript_21215/g.46401  ORF Transcript_21215/g.46401 Transcript_21215/m.46401 type:complete len:212 (-) Transcript_21215:125-760(-)